MNKNDTFFGIGRRKSAVAQVRLASGTGKLTINGEDQVLPLKLQALLDTLDKKNKFDISALIKGGGITSRIDALVLGVARALIDLYPDLRSTLRKKSYLTRDSRIKERKKPGLKRARRAPQWAKR